MTAAFMKIGELAHAMGYRNIVEQDGCCEFVIDDSWGVSVNPHKETHRDSRDCEVPPLSMSLYFNGWPAGVIDSGDGWFAAGEAANEATLIEAVDAQLAQLAQSNN